MPIPVGAKEATWVFSVVGNDHSITHSIGIIDVDVITPRTNAELANLIKTNWSGTGAPYAASNMPTDYRLQNVTVSEMQVDGPISATSTGIVVGTGGQAPVPINCSLLVTKNTGVGGRRNKGRMYLPPFLPGESQVDPNGELDSGVAATIQGQIDVAVAADVVDDIGYQLYHQTGDQTPTAVTELSLANQIATQRRRMRN